MIHRVMLIGLFIVAMGQIRAAMHQEPRVLLLYPWRGKFLGGLSIHHLNHQKILTAHGVYTTTLTLDNILATTLAQSGFLVDVVKKLITRQELLDCCTQHAINVVITPDIFLIPMIQSVAREHPCSIIYMRHATIDTPIEENSDLLQGVDIALGVNPSIVEFLERTNSQQGLGITSIAWMPPCWDEEKCSIATSYEDKATFFKDRFGLVVNNDDVVICTVANLVPVKNHTLLLQALQYLIYEKSYANIHLVCAGDGTLRTILQEQIQAMGLREYVHLVGSISDVALLLHYADIHVLPSVAEGFPLANLEAAYLKKAIITTAGIGAAYLIEHGATGLLFENGNAYSLAEAVQMLVDDAVLRTQLGNNAHERVINYFTNEKIYKKWHDCLEILGYT